MIESQEKTLLRITTDWEMVFKDTLKNLCQHFRWKILLSHHNLNSKTFTWFHWLPVDSQIIILSSLTVKQHEIPLL